MIVYEIINLMKNLIIVGGTMGVGKTATCRELQKILPRNVFLDGDWCWDMHPFVVTEETKAMVNGNIAHLLTASSLARNLRMLFSAGYYMSSIYWMTL